MIFPDAVLVNADWPKRTPDTTAALGAFIGGKGFDPNQPRDEAGKWSAGPGGPNFSTVLPWKDRFPAPSEDPPPGKDYEYHATKAKSLPQIAQTGLRGERTISIAPHLEAANFYGDLVDSPGSPETQAVLLRMRRSDIKIGHVDDSGNRVMRGIEPELDYNETREHVAMQPSIPASVLQVYYKGTWHDLVPTKSFKRNEAPCRVPAGNPDGGRFASCEGMTPATRGPDGWQMADGSPLPDHAPKNIPPAWREVVVATDPEADLLVKGIDAKGRTQSVYSDNHTMRAAAAKFARVNELRAKQDEIDAEIARDLTSSDKATREAAAALRLIRATGLRPGGEGDTGAEKQAYGATTLEGRHIKTSGGNVRLQFTGKKGVDLDIPVLDKAVAADLKERKLSAGAKKKVFDTDASALRDYTAGKDGGGFKPKDFRTAKGTSEAIAKIKKTPTPKDEKEYKKAVREVAKHVSEKLGNTPAIALQSYIDPTVFAVWRAKAMKKSKAVEPCRVPAGNPGGGQFAPCDGGAGGNPVTAFISKQTGIQFSPEGYPLDDKGVEAGTPGYDYNPVYEKVGAARKVANGKIAERLKAVTSAEEAEAFVRGYFVNRPELADENIAANGPHLAMVSLVVGAWNYSSTDPTALALMRAAQEKFGIKGAANVQGGEFAAHSKALGDLAGAIYAETQQQLKDAGIDRVTVYRGMSFQRKSQWLQADGDNVAVQSNPLSSFSSNLFTAEGFTRDDDNSLAVILGGTVPRESIFSIPTSGVGCTTEHEVVVFHNDASRFKSRTHAMTYNYNPDTERSSFPRIYPTEESFWGSDDNKH